MPREGLYGYVQAVKVGNTVYLSGQLSHDDQGNMVAPAPPWTMWWRKCST